MVAFDRLTCARRGLLAIFRRTKSCAGAAGPSCLGLAVLHPLRCAHSVWNGLCCWNRVNSVGGGCAACARRHSAADGVRTRFGECRLQLSVAALRPRSVPGEGLARISVFVLKEDTFERRNPTCKFCLSHGDHVRGRCAWHPSSNRDCRDDAAAELRETAAPWATRTPVRRDD